MIHNQKLEGKCETHEVRVYQVHVATFHVEAQTTANAIRQLLDGDGDELLDSPEFHSICHERGMIANAELLAELEQLGVPVSGDNVCGIAGVKKLQPDA